MSNRRVWILSGVAGLLAVLAALDQFGSSDALAPAADIAVQNGHALPLDATNINPLSRTAFADYDEILRRPLFAPGRAAEPDIVPLGQTSAAGAPLSNYDLKGTVNAANAVFALLKEKSGDAVLWIAAGKAVDGWTLQSVDATHATFARGGMLIVLKVASGTADAATRPGTMDPQLLRAAMAQHPVIPTDSMLGIDAGGH